MGAVGVWKNNYVVNGLRTKWEPFLGTYFRRLKYVPLMRTFKFSPIYYSKGLLVLSLLLYQAGASYN
jgi:hypothetical protein